MICDLVVRGKFKPELEFQAGTSSFLRAGTSSYREAYNHENVVYVEVPEDHEYNTQNSERSDEVSPYLMVAYVQVPVRKLLLLLLLFWLLLLLLLLLSLLLLLLLSFSSHHCVLGESISR